MKKIKCITFDKEAQDNIPENIKSKMKADRENAIENHIFKKGARLSSDKIKETPEIEKRITEIQIILKGITK